MILFMESISQCITAASPARTVWMSFWGMICLALSAQAFPSYCTCTAQFIIFALGKSLLAWKTCIGSQGRAGWHWCRWQQQSLSHSVVLTVVEIVRILSGSTAKLTARAASAINNSGNNNQGCLFFPKLSVSMTDLFWRWLLFWQISGLTVTTPCQCAVCTLTLCQPPVPWWSRQATSVRGWSSSDTTSSCLCLTFSKMSYFS